MNSPRALRSGLLVVFVGAFVAYQFAPGVPAQTSARAQSSQVQSSPPSSSQSQNAGRGESGSEDGGASRETELSAVKITLGLLAGLVLFLYGVSRLSEALKAIGGASLKRVLAKFTTNRFAGVATGTVATTLLDSSSVTIIMVIAVVNAGLLSFAQSLGVIMGANIGTTISSQLYAFDVDEYSPIALLVGFLLYMLTKSERWQQAGLIILGVGLVFFGLHQMGEAVEPLKSYEPFINWMKGIERPLMGALVGAAVTVLIQSSSATLGIIIALASQNLISLPAGVAMMLGAEVGTCADTLIASVGRSREAVRAGLFHLLFNLTTVALGILLVRPFTAFVEWVSGGASVERQIANAHLSFNVAGVLLFIGFVGWIAHALEWAVPADKSEGAREKSSDPQGEIAA